MNLRLLKWYKRRTVLVQRLYKDMIWSTPRFITRPKKKRNVVEDLHHTSLGSCQESLNSPLIEINVLPSTIFLCLPKVQASWWWLLLTTALHNSAFKLDRSSLDTGSAWRAVLQVGKSFPRRNLALESSSQ